MVTEYREPVGWQVLLNCLPTSKSLADQRTKVYSLAYERAKPSSTHPFPNGEEWRQGSSPMCSYRELTCPASVSWLVGTILLEASGWKQSIHSSVYVSVHYEQTQQLPLYDSYFVPSAVPILIHWHLITALWLSTYCYCFHFAGEETKASEG